MATGKVMQPKALLKLPKEIPSNIVNILFLFTIKCTVNYKTRLKKGTKLISYWSNDARKTES